ncbi:MAG: C1 family peptidase [Arenicellales bacterium]
MRQVLFPEGSRAADDHKSRPPKVSERMLYHLARFYDEWPGEDYQGSSCRGAVKAWHKHGVCSEKMWPYRDRRGKARYVRPKTGWAEDAATRPLGVYYRVAKNSITDMQSAVRQVGAVYASASVHAGWDSPRGRSRKVTHDTLPMIAWTPGAKSEGGHAFALVGYNDRGFIVQNSWGQDWGAQGFAILTYDDWRENCSDAWVCVMGAPTRTVSPTYFVNEHLKREKDFGKILAQEFVSATPGKAPDHQYTDPAVIPWDEEKAYRHSVVMANDGKVVPRLVDVQGAVNAVESVVIEGARDFFEDGNKNPPRIAIYAHGGLNSEGASIARIRTMAPYFTANGVYPVFLTWKTGLLETLLSIMQDAAGRLFPRQEGWRNFWETAQDKLAEVTDRTLEVACEDLGVKAIWSQMKQNAEAGSLRADSDRGGYLTARALKKLKQDYPRLQIHLVGHSAGSIVLGCMLDDIARNKLTVSTCTLYAAACSIDFANGHYVRAVERDVLGRSNLYLHMLADERERDDSVGPYQKSLLYLVSRALETWHKTPLLGMARSFDAATTKDDTWNRHTDGQVSEWQSFWSGARTTHLVESKRVPTAAVWKNGSIAKTLDSIPASHGGFDNDVSVVDATLRRITGSERLQHSVENLQY